MMSYVPHTGEGFIYWADRGTPVGETATRYWVGITPRLAIRDEAEGFARFELGSEFGYYTVAYLAPFALDDGPYLVDVQVRFTGEWSTSETVAPVALGVTTEAGGTYLVGFGDNVFGLPIGPWHNVTVEVFIHPSDLADAVGAAAAGGMFIAFQNNSLAPDEGYDLSFLGLRQAGVEGRLAIDTHDHPFHLVGTRDPAMPYELVIDTGTQRLVEIVAGEESLATHELVIDETGRPGTPWSHCGLFRPV